MRRRLRDIKVREMWVDVLLVLAIMALIVLICWTTTL